MKSRRTGSRSGISLLFSACLLCCSVSAQNTQVTKLPSGHEIKILGEFSIKFTQGDPALMLKYQTDLKVSDKAALRKEASEIWTLFEPDVEKGGFRNAVLSANESPRGMLIQRSSGYNFVYSKNADGAWRCLDDSRAPQETLHP